MNNDMTQKSFAREAYISTKACESNHANVVKFWGYSSSSDNWYLVYQFMSGGTVETALIKKKRYMTGSLEDIARITQMALDAANGLLHLHNKKIVHRDIACRNLLMDEAENVWYVKNEINKQILN